MATASSRSRQDWVDAASGLSLETGLFIDGRYQAAQDGATMDCINPANGALLAQVACAQASDVDRAVASGLQAWRDRRWRGLSPLERMGILLRWADLIEANGPELALIESLDMGKPITDVLSIDLPETLRALRYFAQCIDKVEGAVTHTACDALHLITHEPLGVIGAITPWNYPMLMAMWKLAPVLAAGNCVVLKPAEQAPLSCARIVELFIQAGGPPGVFNLVHGRGVQAGQALARHPDIAKICFTGSTAVGKLLLEYAGQSNMKRLALETGGKSPQIFMPDLYDLDVAVERAVAGIYDNAGQVCNAGSRLLVHRSIYKDFVSRFMARARQAYRPGDPLDPATTLGPLVNQAHRAQVLRRIEQGRMEGAQALMLCDEALMPEAGAYVAPTLFLDARNDMQIVQEEIFGPVATLQVFDSEAQALAMANDSIYGLAAAVWTSDLKAAHRMSAALESGVVWVNCFGDGDMTQPFGGFKQSGNSRDKHIDSLLACMQVKSTWLHLA